MGVQVASLTSTIAGLQTELSRARLALADAMRQGSNREEQHRAAVNDLTTSGTQQLEAARAQTQQALVAAAAQHATQLRSLHTAAASTEQLLQARIKALQDGEQHLAKQCSSAQQQLSDEQGRHQASVQAHEAQLAEAAALLVAAQQASGMQLALADSGKQLQALCLAVQQRVQQHHQLAEEAARALPAPLPSQLSLAAGAGRQGGAEALRLHAARQAAAGDAAQLRSQLADLKARMASQAEDHSSLQQQTAQLQQSLSDMVSVWQLCSVVYFAAS